VPLDSSELAEKALPVAEFLCRRLDAELHLVSVVPFLVLSYIGNQAYIPADVYQRIEEDRERATSQYLEQAAAAVQKSENQGLVYVQTHIEHGDAASSLLDIARDAQIDLIVMTTHGRTGIARFALGSVADRVVRGGAAPVLLIRSFATTSTSSDQEIKLEHALVPLDGSPQAEAPLFSLAPLLAGPVLHTVTLLRVADTRDGEPGEQLCQRYLDTVRQRLDERLQGTDCAVNQVVCAGDNPAAIIVAGTADGAYDFVLMATHGEAGIGRWAFGGVTDRVLRDGEFPLLLVHLPRR
jgi:nucleotide-binding universal stress UspA family protein